MLTITSGALHRFLKAQDELPDETLVCGCPIDVRTDRERGTGGNVVGVMGVNLHTEIDKPLKRFKAVHKASLSAKANAQASNVRVPVEIMNTVPGGLYSLATRVAVAFDLGPFNTMLTNVPGPPNQLYFAGARIVEGFGIGPAVPGVGLFHTASSSVMNKQGKINFSFWACRPE